MTALILPFTRAAEPDTIFRVLNVPRSAGGMREIIGRRYAAAVRDLEQYEDVTPREKSQALSNFLTHTGTHLDNLRRYSRHYFPQNRAPEGVACAILDLVTGGGVPDDCPWQHPHAVEGFGLLMSFDVFDERVGRNADLTDAGEPGWRDLIFVRQYRIACELSDLADALKQHGGPWNDYPPDAYEPWAMTMRIRWPSSPLSLHNVMMAKKIKGLMARPAPTNQFTN